MTTQIAPPPRLEVDHPALRSVAAWARTLRDVATRAQSLPSKSELDVIAGVFMRDWTRSQRRSADREVNHTREQALYQADRVTSSRVDQYQLGADVALEDAFTTYMTAELLMGLKPCTAGQYLQDQLLAMALDAERTWDRLLTRLGYVQPWLRDHVRLAVSVPTDGPTRFTPAG
jgi:hypothetical protein